MEGRSNNTLCSLMLNSYILELFGYGRCSCFQTAPLYVPESININVASCFQINNTFFFFNSSNSLDFPPIPPLAGLNNAAAPLFNPFRSESAFS